MMCNLLFYDLYSKTIQSYSAQISELDQIIRRMVLESLGVEKYLEEHLGSTNYLLRVMKYKGPQTTETKLGLNAHTDKNIVTILYQNQIEGLETQTKDGQWISLKPSPDSFVVMIGDSLLVSSFSQFPLLISLHFFFFKHILMLNINSYHILRLDHLLYHTYISI